MDDHIDSVSDITQKPLRPRQPIIADGNVEEHAGLKHFRSEMNVASPPPEIDRRLYTLPNRNGSSSQEYRPHNPPIPINRPRVRPLPTSRPVSAMEQGFVGQGIDAQQAMWCRQGPLVAQQQCNQMQIGPAFSRHSIAPPEENTVHPPSGNRRSKPMRSQSLYANEAGYKATTTRVEPAVYDEEMQRYQALNASSSHVSSPYGGRNGGNDMYGTPSHDRPCPSQPRSTSRGGSVPPEDQQMAGYGGDDRRFPDSSGLPAGPHSSGDAGLASQYNPGNVRHLVHSFQLALKPGGSNTSTPLHSQNARDRAVRPGSAAAALSTVNGSGPQSYSSFDSSMGVYSPTIPSPRVLVGTQLRPDDRTNPGNSEARPDTNVCVVRPASGRSLPQPPHSNEPTPPRNESSAGAGSAKPSSRPSSAKAAKPSVYLDYGNV